MEKECAREARAAGGGIVKALPFLPSNQPCAGLRKLLDLWASRRRSGSSGVACAARTQSKNGQQTGSPSSTPRISGPAAPPGRAASDGARTCIGNRLHQVLPLKVPAIPALELAADIGALQHEAQQVPSCVLACRSWQPPAACRRSLGQLLSRC